MKRRGMHKKILCLLLAVGTAVSLAGCGGKDKESVSKTEENGESKDFVYVAEYQSIEAESLGNSTVNKDTIYFTEGNYNEETEEYKQELKCIKIGETETSVIPVALEKDTYCNSMYVDDEGNIFVVLNISTEENGEYTNTFFLKKYAQDGSELLSMDITGLGDELEYFYVQYMSVDSEGNIYLCGGENYIWILDKEGNEIGKMNTDNWINSMLTLPSGKVAVCYWSNEGKTVLAEIDAASKSLGKTYQNLPNANNGFVPGLENSILGNDGSSIYSYDLDSETAEELLNWIDSDINGDNIRSISMLEDGRILAVSTEWDEESSNTELIYLTKQPAAEVAKKETITFGCMYVDSNVKKNIINFNKTNEKYRVEVKEYGKEDWESGVTQLNNEITSGSGPDIIDLSWGGSAELYISKGILEDLTPYVDADLNRDDYVEKAFNAYVRGDKMYGIVPGFAILTVMGKTSDVGEKQGWTIDDVIALIDSKPEGTELFSYCSKETMLYYLCQMSLDSFVNWETGECKFNDGYFEKVLEFANRFPKEVNYDEDGESVPTKIRNGKLLLQEINISDMQNYQMYSLMFGEPTTFIGFPSNGGTGSYISTQGALGINSKAANKEGAWEFLKSFLTEEYQKENIRWYFPVLKSALDAQFEEDMTPEYSEDENGQKVEQPKTTWGYDDFEAEIYAAKQEDVDAVKALIDSAEGVVSNSNNEITSIINEEAAAFFEGQKNAKDVADIIQSRVQIYVNENR